VHDDLPRLGVLGGLPRQLLVHDHGGELLQRRGDRRLRVTALRHDQVPTKVRASASAPANGEKHQSAASGAARAGARRARGRVTRVTPSVGPDEAAHAASHRPRRAEIPATMARTDLRAHLSGCRNAGSM
jgi:hypothetical protein